MLSAGYHGYSMSNNAVAAYEDGEMPLSKWNKTKIIEGIKAAIKDGEEIEFDINLAQKAPLEVLKKLFLYRSSWHHTSKHYNRTDFYSVRAWGVTDEDIKAEIQKIAEQKQKKQEQKPRICEIEYLECGGTRRRPKATKHTEICEVIGGWCYFKWGGKKSLNSNGTRIIRDIHPEINDYMFDIKVVDCTNNADIKVKSVALEANNGKCLPKSCIGVFATNYEVNAEITINQTYQRELSLTDYCIRAMQTPNKYIDTTQSAIINARQGTYFDVTVQIRAKKIKK